MRKGTLVLTCLLFFAGSSFAQQNTVPDSVLFAGEKHFKNIQQLTFGGDNAEAYWSYDGKYLIFQRTNPKEGLNCDQIFIGKVPTRPGEKFTYKMVSSGKGRTSCSYFLPDGKHIIYAIYLAVVRQLRYLHGRS
jgi:TolB protein